MTLKIHEYAYWPEPPPNARHGLLFCIDDAGVRRVIVGDVGLVMMAASMHRNEFDEETAVGGQWMVAPIPGWPDEWTAQEARDLFDHLRPS